MGNFVVGYSLVKPCFSANEDVWVGYGDEIAKFGCFVFDTLEIYIDDFEGFVTLSLHCLTRFNKIAIQGTPQMAVDKEAISLSRVYSYDFKCTCRYSMCNPP